MLSRSTCMIEHSVSGGVMWNVEWTNPSQRQETVYKSRTEASCTRLIKRAFIMSSTHWKSGRCSVVSHNYNQCRSRYTVSMVSSTLSILWCISSYNFPCNGSLMQTLSPWCTAIWHWQSQVLFECGYPWVVLVWDLVCTEEANKTRISLVRYTGASRC